MPEDDDPLVLLRHLDAGEEAEGERGDDDDVGEKGEKGAGDARAQVALVRLVADVEAQRVGGEAVRREGGLLVVDRQHSRPHRPRRRHACHVHVHLPQTTKKKQTRH